MLILSIIVPVYNVERYLKKCLDSLLQQNLNAAAYEIILINDGSTDGSEAIAQNYTHSYSNIKLFNQENRGLGAARNAGIELAEGKYIQFVDSDDYLEPNALAALIDKMEREQLDVLRFNYQNVNEAYKLIQYKSKHWADYRDELIDGIGFLNKRLGFACYACQFLFRASLLKKEENKFVEGIFFEDTEWTPRILVQANRVNSSDKMVYNYLARSGSITKSVSVQKRKKWLRDKLVVVDCLLRQKKTQTIENQQWYDKMIAKIVYSTLSYVALHFYRERRTYIKQLTEKPIFPLSSFSTASKMKLRFLILNISPALFCFMMHITTKK